MSADTMRRSAKRALLVLPPAIAAAPAFAQRGAMTVPRNLDQLTDRASDIVRGTVVSARVEKHPELSNLDTVVVTLRVHDTPEGPRRGDLHLPPVHLGRARPLRRRGLPQGARTFSSS